MSETQNAALPGLSRLSEEQLREQYKKELGQDAPAELATRPALIDAIKAHRNEAPDTQEEDNSSDSEEQDSVQRPDMGELEAQLGTLNEQDFKSLVDVVNAESARRARVSGTPAAKVELGAAPTKNFIKYDQDGLPHEFNKLSWESLGPNKRELFTDKAERPSEDL